MIKALKFLTVAAVGAVSATSGAVTTDYQEPPLILADPVTEWTGSYANSRVGKISSKFTNSDGEEGQLILLLSPPHPHPTFR
jgi:hypothetical protein